LPIQKKDSPSSERKGRGDCGVRKPYALQFRKKASGLINEKKKREGLSGREGKKRARTTFKDRGKPYEERGGGAPIGGLLQKTRKQIWNEGKRRERGNEAESSSKGGEREKKALNQDSQAFVGGERGAASGGRVKREVTNQWGRGENDSMKADAEGVGNAPLSV